MPNHLRQAAQQVVSEQAEDEGLWFVAATASEAYLQQALRRLHAAVEQPPLPVQEPVGEVTEVSDNGFQCEFSQRLAVGTKLYTAPPAPQRPWVKLTEQDMPSGEDPMFDHKYFIGGMVYAAKVLQAKNT